MSGHSIPTSGSSKRMPASVAGSYTFVHLYAKSATSESTQNPCPKPIGIHSWRWRSSSSSTPSHSPNVGEPRRRSTTTSSTEPRAQRTSLPWPGCVWKWIPRTVPRRERDWLSWTKSDGTPWADQASARQVSMKKPRSSPYTEGARRTSPSSLVSSRCISVEEVRAAASKDRQAMPRTATMPPAAKGHQTLSAYISSRFDEFSRSQKDVAQYVVDHLDEVAFHTAEELARRASTSSSTVVRFAQALGFEGFPELQEAAREEYRHHHRRFATPSAGLEPATPLFSLDQSAYEQAIAADHLNVEDTARKVSRSEVDAAIEMIATADRLLIAGTDQMAFFASYLRHLLMLLDVRAEIAASPSQEALSRLGRIDERTLVVGLSAGRPHPLVVRAMKIARHRKAPTLAIVDATLSEVAKLAERTLYYSSNSPAFVRSHTGLLSLLQALAYGVYSRDAATYEERIRAFKLK